MTLNLTSCTRVREPGFSPSECLELARKIEHAQDAMIGWFPPTDPDCDGVEVLENHHKALIVAALRAYAHA